MMTTKTRLNIQQIEQIEDTIQTLAERADVSTELVFKYLVRKIREQGGDIIDDIRAERFYSER